MTRDALHPCPFCGSDNIDVNDGVTDTTITCLGCGVEMLRTADDGSHARLKARTAWNSRVTDQLLKEAVPFVRDVAAQGSK
jgi:transcription elongation factor Elf1